MSIQWLSRHYQEMKETPSLIVVDEAHHAVAETYAEVIIITQYGNEGLKLEANGVPYKPYFQAISRSEINKYLSESFTCPKKQLYFHCDRRITAFRFQ